MCRYILNASRGKVVDVDATAAALKSGHLAGAYFDVYPSEPKGSVFSPHLHLAYQVVCSSSPYVFRDIPHTQRSFIRPADVCSTNAWNGIQN